MATKTFQEFLKDKARGMNAEEVRKRREEWLAAVDRLMAQLCAWLKEADPEGLLTVVPFAVEKREEGLGFYQAPGLSIRMGADEVQVVPVARNVIGYVGPREEGGVRGEGRVDITDGSGKYYLYRTLKDGERWYVLNEQRYGQPALLDKARFEAVLQVLLS
jgi:hypothetical protein